MEVELDVRAELACLLIVVLSKVEIELTQCVLLSTNGDHMCLLTLGALGAKNMTYI